MIKLKQLIGEGIFGKRKKDPTYAALKIPTVLKKSKYKDHRWGTGEYYYDVNQVTGYPTIFASKTDDGEYAINIPGSKEAKKEELTLVSKQEFEKFLKQFKVK